MKQLTGFTAIILFGIASLVIAGNDEQGKFDIKLKELRTTPAGAAKAQPPPAAVINDGGSIYTVQPGDNLYAILMRHYNLSNEAAERLIPEVMRLNYIKNPYGLTLGQQLKIPLMIPPELQTKTYHKQLQQVPAPTALATPQRSLQSRIQKKQPAAITASQEISISDAPPCILAHKLLKRLNLLDPSTKSILGKDTLTAEHSGLKVVVACGLSSDKAYTYERLLALHNMQLLVFSGTEPSSRVIRKLANRLSLSYQQFEPETIGNQPSIYLFPAFGPGGKDLRVTIIPSGHED